MQFTTGQSQTSDSAQCFLLVVSCTASFHHHFSRTADLVRRVPRHVLCGRGTTAGVVEPSDAFPVEPVVVSFLPGEISLHVRLKYKITTHEMIVVRLVRLCIELWVFFDACGVSTTPLAPNKIAYHFQSRNINVQYFLSTFPSIPQGPSGIQL